MKYTDFPESNKTLLPPSGSYSKDIGEIGSLSVWTNNEQCISCWKMSWKERLSALFFGKAWIAVASGGTQPPIYGQVSKSYLEVHHG